MVFIHIRNSNSKSENIDKAYRDKNLRENRRSADRAFDTQMKNADGYGRETTEAKTPFQKHEAEAKVKEAQKQMAKILDKKISENRKIGRRPMDGYDF